MMVMSGHGHDNRPESSLDERLDSMNKRLGRDVKAQEVASRRPKNEGFGTAFKLSSEFISAILVGAAIGYGIDWLAGTSPWAMILLLLLGFVAGVMNVLRASGEMSGSYELDATRKPAEHDNRD
jgi:ATP synthase protein I